MKIKEKIAAFLSAAAIAISLTACTSTSSDGKAYRTVDEIKESGTLRIGVFSDKNPFGYIDSDGEYKGYDICLAKRLAEDLGVNAELISVEAANRSEYLITGKADIILANFTVTEERAEKVDFALPYMKVSLGVVSPDTAVIASENELENKRLIVVKGTTAEQYFTENPINGLELIRFDEYNEAYSALADGRGDAFSTDNTEVLAWATQNEGFTVGIETLGGIDVIAPAVTKGNETLLQWINDEIISLADESFFHTAYDEELAPVYGTSADKEAIVIEGGEY